MTDKTFGLLGIECYGKFINKIIAHMQWLSHSLSLQGSQ